MNREQTDKLLEKYEQGLTSVEEEKQLFAHPEDSGIDHQVWFQYVNHQKKEVPNDLEDTVWSSIQTRKKKWLIRTISMAASVALLVSLFLTTNPWQKKEMSYEEKAALLEEALAMCAEKKQTIEREILYEDELLIIYTQ